jgi:hypothetical protein
VSALLKRFWADHRLASVISLALLFLGLLIKPWTLVLVLAVAFGGPLVERLEGLASSPVSTWRRSHWIGLALLLSAVLLALTGRSGGQGALILALLPVAWVLATDRGILQGTKEDEHPSLQESLTLSRPADEDGNSAPAECKFQNEIATAEAPERLIGGKLLAKIRELGDIGKSDLVRACGYFSRRPDGSERLDFTEFYEALLKAKGIETSSSSSGDQDKEEPVVDLDALWDYFQEGGGDIWNEEETVYLGTFEGDPGTYVIEVNGPDDYGVPYCTGREDLPRIVEAFIENGGSTSDLLRAISPSSTNSSKVILPEGWEQLGVSEIVERLTTSLDVSAEILRDLSASSDWEVRQAVAWHDNTPADVVEALAEDNDSDVRRATQERSLPKEWRTKSEDDKVSALQAADVPLEVIQALAISEKWTLRQAVAWSPSTPESILGKLKEDDDDDVKVAATTERQLPLDWRFLSGWDKAERLGKESADPAILEILVQSRDSDVRRAVALHPATPEHLISVLREDDNDSVLSGIRERDLPESWKSLDEDERVSALTVDDVSEGVLGILARSNSWTIRQAVARNQASPVTILQELSGDDDSDVSSAAKKALNQKCLPEDWRQLEDSALIERLKTSPDVTTEILRALSGSDDWVVRQAVAWHDNTPADVVELLAKDDDSDVSQATLERCLPQIWRFMSQDEKVEALKSDEVSLDIIEHLASSEKWKLRQAVAWSPSTPESTLEKLKEDNDDDVKDAATTERQLPIDWRFLRGWEKVERLAKELANLAVLEILVQSRDSDVRRAVALHPATPEPLLSLLREDKDDSVQSGLRERDLPDSWKSLDDEAKISALKSDDVPEIVLLILARSSSWTIRQAVALSPLTPQAILDSLASDDDTNVQSAVRERGLPDDWKQLDEDEKVEQLNEGPAEKHVLEILAKSGRWTIRQAVAQNAGATEELLKDLLKDDDDDVKRAARKSLKKLTGEDTAQKGSGPMTYCFGIYQGDTNAGSCYLAELQTAEQDDHEVEGGNITQELREAMEEGCIGWGPFQDQNLIVWTEQDGEEEVIAVIDIEDAISNDNVHDCQVHLGYDTKGKHVVGVLTEKGGYNGEIDLDIESFDVDKVTFGVVNLADRWHIVTSVQYDGEEVGMEGDTTGKSSEYFVFEDDEITNIA